MSRAARAAIVAGAGGAVAPGPALPTTDLLVRLEAADGISLVGGGGADALDVSGWADQSGNFHDVAQTTPAQRPSYEATGGPGGTPRIACGARSRTGSGHFVWPSAIRASAGSVSAFFVIQPATVAAARYLTDTTDTRWICATASSSSGFTAVYDNASAAFREFGVTPTTAQVLAFVFNAGSTIEAFRARTSLGSQAFNTSPQLSGADMRLGARISGTNVLDGYMAAAFIYDGVTDATKRAAIWDYIADAYPGYGVT